jgi:hypothetical protein
MSGNVLMVRTKSYGEHLLHRLLWNVVQDHSERVRELEREWFEQSLVAMVFAFHTVEAYLNYVGERLVPKIWEDEREFFRHKPYRGFDGTLRKVLELVGLSWVSEETPLKTILELKELRDLIAHGKPEKLKGEFVHPLGTEAPALTSTIRQMVTPKEKLEKVLREVEDTLCQIHSLAKAKIKPDDVWFGNHPFQGTSEWSVYSTTLGAE